MTNRNIEQRSPERRARDEQIAHEPPLAPLDLPADAASAPAELSIQRTKGVCGGAARIRNTRYTVWGLVEWRQLGLSDAEILRRHPDLTQADLNTAWGYYERNREEVDQTIRANRET